MERLKPYDFKIGLKDGADREIMKIYLQFQDYVVYRTKTGILIEIDDECDKKDEHIITHYKIAFDLAKIYSWLPEDLSQSEPINRQIARGISNNLAGNHDEAKIILQHAEDRIIKLKTIKGKLHYTGSAFFLVILILLSSLFLVSKDIQLITNILLCGSLGGILSIAIGYDKLNIDIDATWSVNSFIGISRIIIAMIASLFAYFAIESGLAFSFLEDDKSHHGIYLVAMVSGFAEMFIPNMMNNLVKNENIATEQ